MPLADNVDLNSRRASASVKAAAFAYIDSDAVERRMRRNENGMRMGSRTGPGKPFPAMVGGRGQREGESRGRTMLLFCWFCNQNLICTVGMDDW